MPSHPTPQTPKRRENRLARSSSPYLLQHRFNPVDWHPWGAEAFEEARQRNVPIFLSIGYSTCYWCHVMERESFENDAIGAMMNRLFVCIKVDREERPDVDDVYMAAVQAFTSHGGWPMSVFLDPRSLKPFWAGTYFPAEPRGGGGGGAMPTFPRVLQSISDAWRDQRAEVTEQADKLAEAVRERLAAQSAPIRIGVAQVQQAVAGLIRLHDDRHGGFGSAPKFPQPVYIELLLEVRASADEATRRAIDAALRVTLTQMGLGGIFDQVGGGFHRYSVDARWIVPHFEKMLYDSAQLAAVYAAAARLFDEPLYRRIAERTLEYVLREMTAGRGGGDGFFSAQDAEVNHREGQNYLWTPAQVRGVLEPADAELAIKVYALDKGPNFRDPHHPDDPPANVLRWADVPSVVARAVGLSEAELLLRVDRINEVLYAARARRDQPLTDDKVISAWNGLMIGALARAGSLLGRADFTAAGERAAEFVLGRMRASDGGLLRTHRNNGAAGEVGGGRTMQGGGFLEDYACMAHACVELHRAGGGASDKWLGQARRLVADAETRFGDAASGAFFDTLADQPDLFVRARSAYDGALPSGSSVMINTLIDLFEITGDRAYFDRAVRALRSVSAFLADAPLGAAGSTRALLRLLRLDRGAVERTFAADPPVREAVAADFTPVEIHAAVERLALSPGRPASLTLRFRIAEGYHINAADVGEGPDAADLIPLRVSIVGGEGVDIFADYPAGTAFGVEGRLRVYTGGFELTVVLERSGAWTGTPLIGVTYQACTEDACLAPRTVELDVALDAAD